MTVSPIIQRYVQHVTITRPHFKMAPIDYNAEIGYTRAKAIVEEKYTIADHIP